VSAERRQAKNSPVIRTRQIKVDASLFAPALRSRGPVSFRLFPEGPNPVELEARVERSLVRSADMTIYEGVVRDLRAGARSPEGTFTAVVNGPVLAASFITPKGNFQIVPYNGAHVVEQSNPDFRLVCKPLEGRPGRSVTPGQAVRDSGTVADVLVVYTQGALEAYGSHERIATTIELARRNMNQALANSRVDLQIRVVDVQRVPFVPNYSFSTTLDRLSSDADIQARRRTAKADLVMLIRRGGDMLGQAYAFCDMSYGYRRLGYGQLRQDAVANYHVFAHELGHLFGCAHDVANVDACRLRSYSLGTHFSTPNYPADANGPGVGTIMSYRGRTRILYFSYPELTFDGFTVNRRDRNNAATIREAKSIVTNYFPGGN
jgi:hypothetical protein